ncbi:LysR family transcriptional regulator [Nocardioides nitrophenolicus]|uniref:LysR family transcriptional regulator n=1 Tax=Nocardioides nitrophenolicus TaxID=60489 RepID=UPI0019600879|nr:LysR family transcriptional regulator [Nocardioides nitrophenolicus]MBM7520510.1 DNA-binding transcriptional LysR family regulator [Nocardioides nitrophenolicus]
MDLNEVRTFVTLYETGSVTGTAERLHVTQPTVSYTLAKLRRRLGDDLFTRSRSGLEPSAQATSMYGPLREALLTIERTVAGADGFDPATTDRVFTALLSEFGELSFLPLLLPELARHAPRARLRVESLLVDDVIEQLVRGRVDLALTGSLIDDERLERRPFMSVGWAIIVAADHPRIGQPVIEAEQFAAERFIHVRSRAGHDGPTRLLDQVGLRGQVELELTSYSSAPYVVAATELISIVPRHIAEVFSRRHGLQVVELPFYVAPIDVAAYTRRTPGPAQQWLADLVVTTLSQRRLA